VKTTCIDLCVLKISEKLEREQKPVIYDKMCLFDMCLL